MRNGEEERDGRVRRKMIEGRREAKVRRKVLEVSKGVKKKAGKKEE